MAKFSYTAERLSGEVYSGVAEAADRFELYKTIRSEGGRLLHYEDAEAGGRFSLAYWNAKISRVSEQQKIMLARNLGSMMSAGLSLARALGVLERQAGNPRLKEIIAEVGGEVRRGSTLHASFEKFPHVFSKLMIAVVRAGEESGDLPGSLKMASDQLERAHELKKKIRGAMFYPSIVLIAIVVIGSLMMIYVVPTLASTFEQMHATLPFSTRVVIGISNTLTHHTLFALIFVAAVVAVVIVALRSEKGKIAFGWLLLRLPAIGTMTREVNAARTARSLTSLIASGVDVLSALDITRDVVQNKQFKEVVLEAKQAVAQGEPLSITFIKHEKLYPAFVGEMMSVGEETGNTPDMLKNLAIYYEEEVARKTKDLSTIIEPILMLFIGAAVGFFALSMITPIYQVTQNIN